MCISGDCRPILTSDLCRLSIHLVQNKNAQLCIYSYPYIRTGNVCCSVFGIQGWHSESILLTSRNSQYLHEDCKCLLRIFPKMFCLMLCFPLSMIIVYYRHSIMLQTETHCHYTNTLSHCIQPQNISLFISSVIQHTENI
jgi:hypothetical protein